VLAFERGREVTLVYEWFGRLSSVRGQGALIKAPAKGRPGLLIKEVQLLDGILGEGSAFWVEAIDPGSQRATIRLDGGRTVQVPSESIAVLMNAFTDALREAAYRKAE
jgi:hypothetical protein